MAGALITAIALLALGSPTARGASPVQYIGTYTKLTAFQPILVNGQGYFLYSFSRDTATASRCTGACAQQWRPFIASGTVRVRDKPGLLQQRVGTVVRPDGQRQVTYAGRPLYIDAADRRPDEYHSDFLSAFGGSFGLETTEGPGKKTCRCGY